jgi:hypothetical protein
MSTPSAESTRVQLLQYYLAEKSNIAMLEETINVVNSFI